MISNLPKPSRMLAVVFLAAAVLCARAQVTDACYPWLATVSSGDFGLQGYSAEEVCRALVAKHSPQLVNGGTVVVYKTSTGLVDSGGNGNGWYCGWNAEAYRVDNGEPVPSESGPRASDGVVRQNCSAVASGACGVSNPTDPALGVKIETHVDYAVGGVSQLSFARSYRSRGQIAANVVDETRWRHSYDAVLEISRQSNGEPNSIVARRASGAVAIFSKVADASWRSILSGADKLTEQRDTNSNLIGFTYFVAENDSTEAYSPSGRLLDIRARNGLAASLIYSDVATSAAIAPRPGLLIAVRDNFGRELKLTYDSLGRVNELLPPGAVSGLASGNAASPIRYAYAESASLGSGVLSKGQLTSVTWQDGGVRRYHYEDSRFPDALTGITDEAGARYATYSYDAQGRVSRTEHAGGEDRVEFAYGFDANGQSITNVTDFAGPNGSATTRSYTFINQQGVLRPSAVTAPCPLCGSTKQASNYDASGNATKTIAHDGTVTFYAYDTKGRETERATFGSAYQSATARPALTAATSVTSNKWHATWNLPTQTAEPGKISAYTYNSKGNLTGQSWTATTDTTGRLKFSATKTGTTYATGWSYNANSLATTIVERETPAGTTTATETGRWTLAYNSLGDVTSVKDVKRNVTATMTSYDAHGRMLAGKTDADVPINFTYAPRGFVRTKVVNGQTITFIQNAIGLTAEVRMPGNQTLTYVYDATHRLTDIKLNGASITPAMLATAEYPDTVAKATLENLKVLVRQFGEALIPPAFAQSAPLPGRFPVPVAPGQSMPGQPEFDPVRDMMAMSPMSNADKAVRWLAERIAEQCECKPEGGYDKPTYTLKTFAHLYFSGHFSPIFGDKSYFSSSEPVGQALVDEVMSVGVARDRGDRIEVVASLSRPAGSPVGYVRMGGGVFMPSNKVKMLFEKNNCSSKFRHRQEVVTMYPEL